MICTVAVFTPAFVGAKLIEKVAEPPAAMLAGKLMPLTVNKEACVPLMLILLIARFPVPVF